MPLTPSNLARWSGIAGIALASLGCADPKPPPLPDDLEIAVGNGGGIAGAYRNVRVKPDGRLVVEFRRMGQVDEVAAGVLDEAVRREAWLLLSAADLEALGCVPGNMTDMVEMTVSGRTLRACAPMDQGTPEFRRVFGEMERLIGTRAAGTRPPPPPLPPMPEALILEAEDAEGRWRLAREGQSLPAGLDEGTTRLADEEILPLWKAIFATQFYSGASIELRDGRPLPGAPYPRGDDIALRVTVGTSESWETRHRLVEGDAGVAQLAADIRGAAKAASSAPVASP